MEILEENPHDSHGQIDGSNVPQETNPLNDGIQVNLLGPPSESGGAPARRHSCPQRRYPTPSCRASPEESYVPRSKQGS